MHTFTKSLVAFTVLAVAGTAAAQPPAAETEARTTVVSYADLNLASPAGVRALNGRIQRAAAKLCIRDGRKPLQAELYERRCVTAAMSGAQTGIEQALADRSVRHASSAGIQLSAP